MCVSRSRLVPFVSVKVFPHAAFLGYEVLGHRADGVQPRLVRGGKKILQRLFDVDPELGMSDGREPSVRAERLYEALYATEVLRTD